MNKFFLEIQSTSELKDLIAETLKEELTTFFKKENKPNNQHFTRKEVAGMLNVSLPTLHTWTKEGIIKAFRIANRVLYKATDVESALQEVNSIKYSRSKL